MILPACLMALLSVTAVVQYLRSEVIDNKNQDYVRTAQAKGVTEKKVFTNHIFRNSLLPIAAFLGYSITGLLGARYLLNRSLIIRGWPIVYGFDHESGLFGDHGSSFIVWNINIDRLVTVGYYFEFC